MKPHSAPAATHVVGEHAFTHAPLTHDVVPGHEPQLAVRPPQPFAT
jgi:hypothetical protein